MNEQKCAGPFVSAFDCPVHDPRRRPLGPTSAVEAVQEARAEGERTGRAALADAVSRLLADPDISTHALLYRIGQLVDAAAAPGTEDRQ